MKAAPGSEAAPAPRGTRAPTPIPVSRRVRTLLILSGIGLLLLIAWAVPALLGILLGGFAVALVLALPVQLFARVMPRSLATLFAFLILLAVLILAFYVLAPLFLEQVGALIGALPDLLRNLEDFLMRALEALDRTGLLPRSPEDIASRLSQDLQASLEVVTGNLVGGTLGFVTGTFSFALTLFAIVFVAASLLANARGFKATYLRSVPGRYRHDALELWDTLAHALTSYLGGLLLILLIQGGVSAVALFLIGVPYPLALGAWVSVTAVLPYLGAWIGAVPAVLVAFSVSPTAVVLTVLAFLAIQQLEGNILTPVIQGQTIRVPAVVVFLAVIAGGALFGLVGVLFAVPALAVARVLFDFFRVRLRTV